MEYGDITIQNQADLLPVIKRFYTNKDMSTAGTTSVTGIGFKPKGLIAFSVENTTSAASFFGYVATDFTHDALFDRKGTAGTYAHGGGIFYVSDGADANNISGTITSWDSDGFSISWTRNGTPSGTLDMSGIVFK